MASLLGKSGRTPQPVRGEEGARDPGPRDPARDREDRDLLAPPGTDGGTVSNLKFSFADAHNRLQPGGWAREVTERELPVAKQFAGVNVRLKAGAVRELHWHPNNDEWRYYIEGEARMTVFASGGKARTFDYRATTGPVTWVMRRSPRATPSRTPGPRGCASWRCSRARFQDVSLKQWMALMPHALVQQHLHVDRALLDALPRERLPVMPGTSRKESER